MHYVKRRKRKCAHKSSAECVLQKISLSLFISKHVESINFYDGALPPSKCTRNVTHKLFQERSRARSGRGGATQLSALRIFISRRAGVIFPFFLRARIMPLRLARSCIKKCSGSRVTRRADRGKASEKEKNNRRRDRASKPEIKS